MSLANVTRLFAVLLAGAIFVSSVGCGAAARRDLLFGAMSPFYTEGTDDWEKKRHFDQQVEAWEGQEAKP